MLVIQKLCNVFEWYPTSKHFGGLRAKSHTFLARLKVPRTRNCGNKTKKTQIKKRIERLIAQEVSGYINAQNIVFLKAFR